MEEYLTITIEDGLKPVIDYKGSPDFLLKSIGAIAASFILSAEQNTDHRAKTLSALCYQIAAWTMVSIRTDLLEGSNKEIVEKMDLSMKTLADSMYELLYGAKNAD